MCFMLLSEVSVVGCLVDGLREEVYRPFVHEALNEQVSTIMVIGEDLDAQCPVLFDDELQVIDVTLLVQEGNLECSFHRLSE